MPNKQFEFPVRKLSENMTLVVKISSEFKIRTWIALRLVWLAAKVLGCGFKTDGEDQPDA